MEKISDVLGMEYKEYQKKYRKYLKEFAELYAETSDSVVTVAEKMEKWLKEDTVLKLIVVIKTLGAYFTQYSVEFADLSRITPYHVAYIFASAGECQKFLNLVYSCRRGKS